jgi:Raf kinase inhibitor-like YbhB/YbcL family protein
MLVLETSAFQNNGFIPSRYSCEGENISPALSWRDAPAGTKSFALVCYDPDAPGGTFYHWGIWDIPGDRTGLPMDFKPRPGDRAIGEAINGFGKRGYGGPCPPKGHGVHHYHFKLFALDAEHLPLDHKAARCDGLKRIAAAHALAAAELIGLYKR